MIANEAPVCLRCLQEGHEAAACPTLNEVSRGTRETATGTVSVPIPVRAQPGYSGSTMALGELVDNAATLQAKLAYLESVSARVENGSLVVARLQSARSELESVEVLCRAALHAVLPHGHPATAHPQPSVTVSAAEHSQFPVGRW